MKSKERTLHEWLRAETGRNLALARHLRLTEGRISQMSVTGVPDKYKLAISQFTGGAVSVESMVRQRAPNQKIKKEPDYSGKQIYKWHMQNISPSANLTPIKLPIPKKEDSHA